MKKLVIFVFIIGLAIGTTQSAFAQCGCSGLILQGGWSVNAFKSGVVPARTNVFADYWRSIGFVGATSSFPSKSDDRLSVGLRGGFHIAGYYVGLSPYAKVAYNHFRTTTADKQFDGIAVGYGGIFRVRFMDALGVFVDVSREHPISTDNTIGIQKAQGTAIAFGVSVFLF